MRPVLAASLASILAVGPLPGQSKSGHVYSVLYYQVNPGQEAAYARAIAEKARPLLNQAAKRGVIVSYLDLRQQSGAAEHSNVLIIELQNWAALDGLQERLGRISQDLYGQSFEQYLAGFAPLRRFLRTEYHVASAP